MWGYTNQARQGTRSLALHGTIPAAQDPTTVSTQPDRLGVPPSSPDRVRVSQQPTLLSPAKAHCEIHPGDIGSSAGFTIAASEAPRLRSRLSANINSKEEALTMLKQSRKPIAQFCRPPQTRKQHGASHFRVPEVNRKQAYLELSGWNVASVRALVD